MEVEIEEDMDEVVGPGPLVRVRFDPLRTALVAEFVSPAGRWTRRDLIAAVLDQYAVFFAEEKAALVPRVDRRPPEGKHGIWGHRDGWLFLTGLRKGADGIFELLVE